MNLFTSNSTNLKNLEGKTAWDILQEQTQVDNNEIKAPLCDARPLTCSCLPILTSYVRRAQGISLRKFVKNYACELTTLTDEKHNALLVVAVLLVSVTYQAVLNPPGGLWQEDKHKN